MKLYVTVEEFLYAKKIENQTERTLRGYKNTLNLFANWLQKEWTIDELEKIRVVHLKQYVAYGFREGMRRKNRIHSSLTQICCVLLFGAPLLIGNNI